MKKINSKNFIDYLNREVLKDLVEISFYEGNKKLVLMQLNGHDIRDLGFEGSVKFHVQLLSGSLEFGDYKFFLPLKEGFSFSTDNCSDCCKAIINHIMERIETLSSVERKDILYILAVNLSMEIYSLKVRKELKYLPTVIF